MIGSGRGFPGSGGLWGLAFFSGPPSHDIGVSTEGNALQFAEIVEQGFEADSGGNIRLNLTVGQEAAFEQFDHPIDCGLG